jgi:hypothetical protein
MFWMVDADCPLLLYVQHKQFTSSEWALTRYRLTHDILSGLVGGNDQKVGDRGWAAE